MDVTCMTQSSRLNQFVYLFRKNRRKLGWCVVMLDVTKWEIKRKPIADKLCIRKVLSFLFPRSVSFNPPFFFFLGGGLRQRLFLKFTFEMCRVLGWLELIHLRMPFARSLSGYRLSSLIAFIPTAHHLRQSEASIQLKDLQVVCHDCASCTNKQHHHNIIHSMLVC